MNSGWKVESNGHGFRVVRYVWWWPFGPLQWLVGPGFNNQVKKIFKELSSAKLELKELIEEEEASALKWKDVLDP